MIVSFSSRLCCHGVGQSVTL